MHFLGAQDSDAEDVIQDTFLVAFRKLKDFEPRASLYTWLAHICVNICYKRMAKRGRQLATATEDLERLTAPEAGAMEREERAEGEKKARLEALERLTQSLSERCRKVLTLRDKQGESYAAISGALKMPIGTVMSQLARCREALRNLLKNELDS